MTHDLRLAIRLLASSPGFAIPAFVTLALAIGGTTSVFSVIDAVLLRPAPVAHLEELVMVWETDRDTGTTREPASVPDYLDFQARTRAVRGLSGFIADEVNARVGRAEATRMARLHTGEWLLRTLGVEPRAGRLFTTEEHRRGAARVALISESLWARAFGRDPGVIGRTVTLDDQPHEVVGVVGNEAAFGVHQVLSAAAYGRGFADHGDAGTVDVWVPLAADPETFPRETHPLLLLGRLSAGTSPASAQQDLAAIALDLERTYRVNQGRGVFVEPLADVVYGPSRPALLAVAAGMVLLLLVACANVATLIVARGTRRVREVAVRAALGASPRRLARQFLVEQTVLTLAATAAGVTLAHAGVRVLVWLAPARVPRLDEVGIDTRVLGATFATSLVVTLAFALVPLLQSRRLDLVASLAAGAGRSSAAGAATRGRSAFVVLQTGLAVALVIGAGLLARTVWNLRQVDPGFRPDGVLKVEYQLPPSRYPADFRAWPDFREMHRFTEALVRRASTLPGVTAAAVAGNHPLDPGFTNSFVVVGREREADAWPEISVRRVTPAYFRTVGLPLVRGRLFDDRDATPAPPVALVNEAAARRFFAGRDPVGARIRFWGAERTIVGIVADERFQGLGAPAPIGVYLPLAQAPSANGANVLLLRSSRDPLTLAPEVRAALRGLDPGVAPFGVERLAHTVARSIGTQRFTLWLLGAFAGIAVLLAGVGLHGALAYAVAQRTREIGIRVALGARPSRLLAGVVGTGMALAAMGLGGGVALSLAGTRLLQSLLFGVAPIDRGTIVGTSLLVAVVALLASWVPARRAVRIDPVTAIRSE